MFYSISNCIYFLFDVNLSNVWLRRFLLIFNFGSVYVLFTAHASGLSRPPQSIARYQVTAVRPRWFVSKILLSSLSINYRSRIESPSCELRIDSLSKTSLVVDMVSIDDVE